MDLLFYIGIVWVICGILGMHNKFVGVPKKVKGSDKEETYRKYQGKTFMLLGSIWVIVAIVLLLLNSWLSILTRLAIYLLASIPAFVYERKWKKHFSEQSKSEFVGDL